MALFTIDREKCDRDGICVAECPERVIEASPEDAFPSPTEHAEALCLRCGHCVAVCPQGAFSWRDVRAEACPPIRRELAISAEQMEHHILSRRSVRTYKKKAVDKAVLQRLLEVSRYAPTAKNLQPVHWLVIMDPAEVKRMGGMVIDWMEAMLKGESKALFTEFILQQIVNDWKKGGDWICRGAPHIIVAHGPNDLPIPASASGCMIALTTLELAAPSFGLGACWAGYFNAAAISWPPLTRELRLPPNHDPYGAMMIGYPTYKYHRIPPRDEVRITWR